MSVGQYLPLLLAIGVILLAYRLSGIKNFFKEYIKSEIDTHYDIIIVGGGTAGCVLASRLAESFNGSILLLEQGPHPSIEPDSEVPVLADLIKGDPDHGPGKLESLYLTEPQEHSCRGYRNQSCLWHMGRGLGGTSNINYMLYVRGNRYDYDAWADSTGDPTWSYKDVLPYFIKSEDQRRGDYVKTVFHGFGGRMSVSDYSGQSQVTKVVEGVFNEIGLKQRDYNGRTQYGWGPAQATIRRGIRWGTFNAYLKKSLSREKLRVVKDTLVTKIFFDGSRAAGVVLKRLGKQQMVRARTEVILCAGTIGSAKLLLLSGVGPRNHLAAMNIPLVANLPVGENLRDQIQSDPVQFLTPNPGFTINAARSDNLYHSWNYWLQGSGMKSSPRFREALAFIRLRSRKETSHMKQPLVMLQILANPLPFDPVQINADFRLWESIHGELGPVKEGLSICATLLHPFSKGYLRLRSRDPEDDVSINPNYLSNPIDIKLLAEAYIFARRLGNTQSMKELGLKSGWSQIAACSSLGNYTEAYVECHLRHLAMPVGSPVGTCRMGSASDPNAVVDSQLRVKGFKNLRVVDASIISEPVSADTYAVQVMIAEKAADMILERDSVFAIREYFKHLYQVRHKKVSEDENLNTS